jgi:hypothetical protein
MSTRPIKLRSPYGTFLLLACSSPTRTTPLAGGATVTSVAITNLLTQRRVARVPKVAAAAREGAAPRHPGDAQQ